MRVHITPLKTMFGKDRELPEDLPLFPTQTGGVVEKKDVVATIERAAELGGEAVLDSAGNHWLEATAFGS